MSERTKQLTLPWDPTDPYAEIKEVGPVLPPFGPLDHYEYVTTPDGSIVRAKTAQDDPEIMGERDRTRSPLD